MAHHPLLLSEDGDDEEERGIGNERGMVCLIGFCLIMSQKST